VLQGGYNIIFVARSRTLALVSVPIGVVVNGEGYGRPVTQILPDWGPVSTEKLQIELEWRFEYDISPPLAYVYQPSPLQYRAEGKSISVVAHPTEVKYF
jgi:hypothetical protein